MPVDPRCLNHLPGTVQGGGPVDTHRRRPPAGSRDGEPLVNWKQDALLELAIALSFVPWHLAVACLAAHLAYIAAGGGQ